MSFALSYGARAKAPRTVPRAKIGPLRFSRSEAGGLLRLAAPIVLIALVNMGMSVTDTMMVSWFFGTDALAAVAIGSDLYSIVLYLGTGVIGGLSPFVASAVARQSVVDQDKYRQIGWIVTGATAILLFPAVWFAPDTLAYAGLDPNLLEAGRGYTQAMALTLVPMLVVILFRTLLTAAERPKVFLRVTLAALPLNAVANAVFMQGFAVVPAYGPTGAGISSCVVAAVMAITLAVIFRAEIRGRISSIAVGWPDLTAVAEVVRVGIPIGVAMLAELGIFLGATLYAATLSAADVAAHTITLRLAGVFYAIPLGLLQASTVRIARRDGDDTAGKQRVIATSIAIAVIAGAALAVLLVALAPGITEIAFDATKTGMTAASLTFGLLMLLALIEIIDAPASAAAGLLRGLKDTKAPMAYVLIGYWVVAAPLGVALSKGWDMGITGVWIALALGTLVTTGLTVTRLPRYWRRSLEPPSGPAI